MGPDYPTTLPKKDYAGGESVSICAGRIARFPSGLTRSRRRYQVDAFEDSLLTTRN